MEHLRILLDDFKQVASPNPRVEAVGAVVLAGDCHFEPL